MTCDCGARGALTFQGQALGVGSLGSGNMKGQRCDCPVPWPEGDRPPPGPHCQEGGHALEPVQLELEVALMR